MKELSTHYRNSQHFYNSSHKSIYATVPSYQIERISSKSELLIFEIGYGEVYLNLTTTQTLELDHPLPDIAPTQIRPNSVTYFQNIPLCVTFRF